MENSQIKIFPSYEDLYQEYINKTLENSKKYKDIYLNAKLLHYFNKPTFYYYCLVNKNSNSNPFFKKILFGIEFIDGEIPYVSILTDFLKISMNDNRNYYKCLSYEHKYKFSLDNFEDSERILETIIQGIPNFLTFVKESDLMNTFIFFGEYEYNHIYQINDFLQNKNILKFYRIYLLIYHTKNKYVKEERYIIFTKLYFLFFEPLEEDKALIRLLFCQKLKDMDISLETNEINNSIIFKFVSSKKTNEIEFILIDRERTIEKKVNINNNKVKNINGEKIENKIEKNDNNNDIVKNEIKEIKDKNNDIIKNEIKEVKEVKEVKEIKDKNNQIAKNEIKEVKEVKEIKDKSNKIAKNEIKEIKEKKVKINNSNLMKEWFDYLNNIDFKKYEIVIYNYKMIFRDYKGKLKIKSGEKCLIKEYNDLIEFYEKIINFYENNNKGNNKERINKLIGEIIYLCSELINYAKNQNKNENEYLLKIQKYLKSYK